MKNLLKKKKLLKFLKPNIRISENLAIIGSSKSVLKKELGEKISKRFNGYGWDTNSGYGTKEHLKAIKKIGITKYHRKTFSPICDLL